MKKVEINYLVGVVLVAVGLSGCAHHQDVRPGTKGVHRVSIKTEDKEQGSRDAISQANHYCEQYGKRAAFETEDQKYTGDLDESTYNAGKRVSKVAKVIGGTTWAMGGDRESNAGGIVGLGGMAGDAALGKGYSVDMTFQCL